MSDLHRDVIDVRDEVTLRPRPSNDLSSTETQNFRVVGLWNEAEERYHLYITNLSAEAFDASDIGLLYRARWEVEWTFKALKSWFRLDELDVEEPVIIEALILIAALSLVVCRVILDELRELEAQQAPVDVEGSPRDRIPRRRGSLAMQRFGGVILVYVMLELGFGLPDLDELLLFVAREPNPHRDRLRTEVERGSFGANLA